MQASLSRQSRFAAAIAAGLLVWSAGCARPAPSTSSAGTGDAGMGGATGGSRATTNGASGGTTSDAGGPPNSGGHTTATGGTGSGGQAAATGGNEGTGGRASGTGGRTDATGGTNSGGTGGTSGSGGSGAPADAGRDGARADGPADAADLSRERVPDSGPGDVPADNALPGDDGGSKAPEGYKLVWSDEFDVDGTPNAKNWTYEKGFARNEELQWYQSDNATVKGGLLVIEGRKERVANPNYQAGSSDWKTNRQYAEYTSTSMTTWNLQKWRYGRFEMRARVPTGAGMWPAWWTLGVSGEWPANGEIDIMEYYKGNILANVACGTATRWQAKWDSSSKSVSSLGGAAWAAEFHVWRMDWDDQKIDLYVDDLQMNTTALASMLNADGTSPFKQEHYMLVNLAIGGVNGGDPAGTTFPVKYEVDWIRVFQKL